MRTRRRRLLIAMTCPVVVVLILMLKPRQPKLYTVTVLPSLGGDFTLPCAINERGQITGVSEVARGTCHLSLGPEAGEDST